MICPKCKCENEDGAMYCSHCGSSMNPVPEKESNVSSVLIFVWIIAVAVFSLFITVYTKVVDQWYEGTSKMVYIGICILQNIVQILPAFAIKNKTLRIIGVVIMAALIMWWIYRNIQFATEII